MTWGRGSNRIAQGDLLAACLVQGGCEIGRVGWIHVAFPWVSESHGQVSAPCDSSEGAVRAISRTRSSAPATSVFRLARAKLSVQLVTVATALKPEACARSRPRMFGTTATADSPRPRMPSLSERSSASAS